MIDDFHPKLDACYQFVTVCNFFVIQGASYHKLKLRVQLAKHVKVGGHRCKKLYWQRTLGSCEMDSQVSQMYF